MLRQFVVGAAALLMVSGSIANAGEIFRFDKNGGGGAGTVVDDFIGFDWEAGNALADGGNLAVANWLQNDATGSNLSTTFDLYYHARVTFNPGGTGIAGTLTTESGGDVPSLGEEFTVIAGFRETVLNVDLTDPTAPTVTFGLVSGDPNFLQIYHDTTADADTLAGTGFNDGTLIFDGNVTKVSASTFTADIDAGETALDSFGSNQYVGQDTIVGSGSTQLFGESTFVNDDYFLDFQAGGAFNMLLMITEFDTTQTVPFDSVNPSAAFYKSGGPGAPTTDGAGSYNGVSNPSLGLVNGAFTGEGGPDVQFEADGNQSFGVVPEPTTAAMWMIGSLAVLPGLRRRRSRS